MNLEEMVVTSSTISNNTNNNNYQNQKTHHWQLEEKHVIVIPSLSFDHHELSYMSGILHYEERMLYSLLALSSPNTFVTVVTSMPLDQNILKYYQSLIGTTPSSSTNNHNNVNDNMNADMSIEDRVQCLSVCDASDDACLTQKILNRPRLLNRLKDTIRNHRNRHKTKREITGISTANTGRKNSICDNDSNYSAIQKERVVEGNVGKDECKKYENCGDNDYDDDVVLMVWVGTELESHLAKELGLKLYAAAGPEQTKWGTKAGSRELFHTLNIPCVDGTYKAAYNEESLIDDIIVVLKRNPYAKRGIVKLMEGFSGQGNAIIDCTKIQQLLQKAYKRNDDDDKHYGNNYDDCSKKEEKKGDDYEEGTSNHGIIRTTISKALNNMKFSNDRRTWCGDFEEEVRKMGAIFELYIESSSSSSLSSSSSQIGTSPSVQVVVNEDSTVTVLSTHEQILDGQVYGGCEFPCYSSYRTKLMEYGYQVGIFLAKQNVIDHFSVDFMCIPKTKNAATNADDWDIYAVEINLRLTGTTHPWMTMKLLTNGYTDTRTGLFESKHQNNNKKANALSCNKYYVASDSVRVSACKRLLPMDLLDLLTEREALQWNPITQTGVVFHMLSCMSETGKIGMTAIENSREEAQELFNKVSGYLREETQEVLS